MTKVQIIEREGLFAKYTLSIIGPRGGTQSWSIKKSYKLEKLPDGKTLVKCTTIGSSTTRASNKGTISGGTSTRPKEVMADEIQIVTMHKDGSMDTRKV